MNEAFAAQRDAMAVAQALRIRSGPDGDDEIMRLVESVLDEHDPRVLVLALAGLIGAVARIAERRTARILASPELLATLATLASMDEPASPSLVAAAAEDLLAVAGRAAVLVEPLDGNR